MTDVQEQLAVDMSQAYEAFDLEGAASPCQSLPSPDLHLPSPTTVIKGIQQGYQGGKAALKTNQRARGKKP